MENEFRSSEQWDRDILQSANQAKHDAAKQRKKNRKSMGRRVSFAPDAQLETMHLYTQDRADQNTDPEIGRAFTTSRHSRVELKQQYVQSKFVPSPGLPTLGETGTELMEISNIPDSGGVRQTFTPERLVIGEVTADVPSIGDLLHSDGETELLAQNDVLADENDETGTFPQLRLPGEITSMVPSLADLLQSEGETENFTDAQHGDVSAADQWTGNHPPDSNPPEPSPLNPGAAPDDQHIEDPDGNKENAPSSQANQEEPDSPDLLAESPQVEAQKDDSNQINKWGFAPGEDDTQDLNLERKGRMIMGDHTYKHVYENNTESTKDVNWADTSISPAKLDILFKRADSASQVLRSAIQTNLDSPGSARRRSMLGRSPANYNGNSPAFSQPPSSVPEKDPRDVWPKSRLSDAFSHRSVMAQRPGPPGDFSEQGPAGLSPFEQTPMSRRAIATPNSLLNSRQFRHSVERPQTRDLLTGDPYKASPLQTRGDVRTPGSVFPASVAAPSTGPNSVDKPLIDLGTPQAERVRSMDGKSPRNMVDAFSSMPVKKKSRMSIVSTGNDSTGRLIQEDLTDDLLCQDDQEEAGSAQIHGSLLKSVGKDMTTRLLLEDSFGGSNSPQFPAKGLPWGGAMHLRAFAAAAGSPSQKHRSPRVVGERTIVTERLLEDSTSTPARSNLGQQTASNTSVQPAEQNLDESGLPDDSADPKSSLPPSEEAIQPREDDSMVLNIGRAGSQLLEDISLEALDAPAVPSPDWPVETTNSIQNLVPAVVKPITPSVFPGGALLPRTPVQKKRKENVGDSSMEPPLTRHRAQVLATAEKKRSSPAPQRKQPGKSLVPEEQSTPQPIPLQSPARSRRQSTPRPKPPLHPSASANKLAMVTRSAAKTMQTPASAGGSQQRGSHRLARTPIRPVHIEPMTLQGFLREVDIHFLDHMRRGASINLADLASDPPPSGLQDSYMLMCLTAPEVAQYEDALQTLQGEIAARKSSGKEKEDEISSQGLPIFQQIENAGQEDHDAIAAGAQALKKLCRVRTNLSWKEWRVTMEAQRSGSLQAKLQVLKHDEAFLQSNLKYLRELGTRITHYTAESKKDQQAKREAHAAELKRRTTVTLLRASLQEQQESNSKRASSKAALDEDLVTHRAHYSMLEVRRAELESKLAALQDKVQASHQALAAIKEKEITPEALASKMQRLDILQGCTHWHLQNGTEAGTGNSLSLKFGPFFQFNITFRDQNEADVPVAAVGTLELTPEGEWPARAKRFREMAASVVEESISASGIHGSEAFDFQRVSSKAIQATLQELTPRLQHISENLSQLLCLHTDFPMISHMSHHPDGSLGLIFSHMKTLSRVSLQLHKVMVPPGCASAQQGCTVDVQMPGEHKLTKEAVQDRLNANGGKYSLKSICQTMSLILECGLTNLSNEVSPHSAPEEGLVANQPLPSAEDMSGAAEMTVGVAPQEDSNPMTEEQDDSSLNLFSNPLFNSAASARKPAARQ